MPRHQRQSEVIRGHRWSSEVIGGHQRQSEAISGPRLTLMQSRRPSACNEGGHQHAIGALGLRSCSSERANHRGHRSSAARPDRKNGIRESPSSSTTGCPGSLTDFRRCAVRRPPAVEDDDDADDDDDAGAQDDAGAHKSSRVGKMSRASTGAMISMSRGASRSVRPGTAMSSGMRVASSCNVYLDHRACWPRANPARRDWRRD